MGGELGAIHPRIRKDVKAEIQSLGACKGRWRPTRGGELRVKWTQSASVLPRSWEPICHWHRLAGGDVRRAAWLPPAQKPLTSPSTHAGISGAIREAGTPGSH